jgi:hypothetical protein
MDSRDREARDGRWYDRFDSQTMTIFVELPVVEETDDGPEVEEVTFPARFEVCGLCDGRGNHVNPSIDAHGISGEEFDEDPDFREEYARGTYDVSCYRCRGDRVEPVVDEACAGEADLKRLHEYLDELTADRRERDAEERWGC